MCVCGEESYGPHRESTSPLDSNGEVDFHFGSFTFETFHQC